MNKFYLPNSAAHTIHVTLFLLVIFLGGCTHSNLLSKGDTYAEQHRYELAIAQYDQALQIKPGRNDTHEKLKQAEVGFQHWLRDINDAADIAYEGDEKGRALILYGKVLAAGGPKEIPGANLQAEARFQALQTALMDQSLLQVKATYPVPIFGQDLESDVADILPILNDYSGLPNQREYSFTLDEFDKKITEQDEERIGEYISGTQLVENPEIDRLQNRIHHLNHEVKELRHDRKKYKHRIRDAERTIAQIEDDHAEQEVQDGFTQSQAERNSEELKQAKAQLRKTRRKLRKTISALEDYEDRLHHTIDNLDVIPATIAEDVYSTHSYFVTHSAYILTGEVLVTTAGHTVAYPLEVVDNDSYHDAQPLLELNADPLVQISAEALIAKLHASARTVAQNIIRDEVQKYRADLLTSANTAVGTKARFEKLVNYGLSGRNGVSRRVANQMEEELQAAYGMEGEFPINRILYGF